MEWEIAQEFDLELNLKISISTPLSKEKKKALS